LTPILSFSHRTSLPSRGVVNAKRNDAARAGYTDGDGTAAHRAPFLS
jgi:hypothetical protein